MNYTQLVNAIQSYMENTFPAVTLADGTVLSSTAQIDRFIQQAELRIYNTVQFPALRKNVTGFFTPNNKYLACPTDFLSVHSIAVISGTGAYSYLVNKDVNFIREAYPNPTDVGLPRYYALFGPQYNDQKELTFIVGPTPNTAYDVELHYFFYPESITTSASGTTWLGDNFDSVLLYGALVEAYTFMKGETELLALYNGKFKEALDAAKRLGDGLERGDSYRDGQAVQKVT